MLATAWSLIWNTPMNNFHALTGSTKGASKNDWVPTPAGTPVSCSPKQHTVFRLMESKYSQWHRISSMHVPGFQGFFYINRGRMQLLLVFLSSRSRLFLHHLSSLIQFLTHQESAGTKCLAYHCLKWKAYHTDMEKDNQWSNHTIHQQSSQCWDQKQCLLFV